jgi:hypothetical protein
MGRALGVGVKATAGSAYDGYGVCAGTLVRWRGMLATGRAQVWSGACLFSSVSAGQHPLHRALRAPGES